VLPVIKKIEIILATMTYKSSTVTVDAEYGIPMLLNSILGSIIDALKN